MAQENNQDNNPNSSSSSNSNSSSTAAGNELANYYRYINTLKSINSKDATWRQQHEDKWRAIMLDHPQFFLKWWSDRPEGKEEAKRYLKARAEPLLDKFNSDDLLI
jgi:hypothetical protein